MKKILLGSTAVAAAALFAGSAMADPNVSSGSPLTISGYYAFQGALGFGDAVPNGADRDYDYITGGRIQLDWKQTADNGLSYGARVRLEINNTDGSSDISVSNTNAYVFVSGGFGTVKAGDVGNAAGENYYLIADDKCLGGCWAGNVEGKQLYNFTVGIPLPQQYPDDFAGTGLWYKTPDIGGFTATISFHPVQGDYGYGTATYFSDPSFQDFDEVFLGDMQNLIAANVNYHGEFEGGTFDVGGHAEYADINGANGGYYLGYGAGAKAYFGPFGVSAWYVANERNDYLDSSAQTVWLSASYGFGPFTAIAGAALTWGDAEFVDNDLGDPLDVDGDDFSGATYALTLQDELAPGLVAYVEGTYSTYESDGDDLDGGTLGAGLHFGF